MIKHEERLAYLKNISSLVATYALPQRQLIFDSVFFFPFLFVCAVEVSLSPEMLQDRSHVGFSILSLFFSFSLLEGTDARSAILLITRAEINADGKTEQITKGGGFSSPPGTWLALHPSPGAWVSCPRGKAEESGTKEIWALCWD